MNLLLSLLLVVLAAGLGGGLASAIAVYALWIDPRPVPLASLALNALGLAGAAAFVRRKGGLRFLKSRLAARGVGRDAALDRFESAYKLTRVELFERFAPGPGDLVMLGDSLTEGAPWADLLPGVAVRNQGIAGDTVPGVLARLEAVGRPGAIALLVGINDLNQGASVDAVLDALRALLPALAARAPRVIVQSLLPIDSTRWGVSSQRKLEALNPRLRALARELGLDWLDLHPLFSREGLLDPACSHDGLHLNAKGYERWATALRGTLENS